MDQKQKKTTRNFKRRSALLVLVVAVGALLSVLAITSFTSKSPIAAHLCFGNYDSWMCTDPNLVPGMGSIGKGSLNYWIQLFGLQLNVWEPLQQMAIELQSVMLIQIVSIGQFLDAKNQIDTQRTFQELTAEAHKDYHPSTEMCMIGTSVRNMAAAEQQGIHASLVLSQRSIDRQFNGTNSISARGPNQDRQSRYETFIDWFAQCRDNSGNLENLCVDIGWTDPEEMNLDIDYPRVFDQAKTLKTDFIDSYSGAPLTEILPEMGLTSMTNNLFAHDVFSMPTGDVLKNRENWQDYLELRSVVAKRAVAENSFYSILGLKTQSPDTVTESTPYPYMAAVLSQLGITDQDETLALLGDRPSYYAQMELLSKKLYQRPEFFVNLYDKPANVKRKDTAMKAIGSMLNRDIARSEFRTEALLAVLLELEMIKLQESVDNRISTLDLLRRK